MAGLESSRDIGETPGWRVGLLFFAFGAICLLLDKTFELCEHHFRQRKGLLITVKHVKNEILMLGALSLILIAVQDQLLKICIPSTTTPDAYATSSRALLADQSFLNDNINIDCASNVAHEHHYASQHPLSSAVPPLKNNSNVGLGNRKAFSSRKLSFMSDVISDGIASITGAPGRSAAGSDAAQNGSQLSSRRLAAAIAGPDYCGDGYEPFWSARTMFQTHILLFLIAVVHIVYAGITMILCLWKVRCECSLKVYW